MMKGKQGEARHPPSRQYNNYLTMNNKEQPEQEERPTIQAREVAYNYSDSISNALRIGDLEIRSFNASIVELSNLALQLLNRNEIKDYLEIRKNAKRSGTLGVG